MALRTILVKGDEALLKKSRPVVDFNKRLHALLDDMAQTLHEADGLGLAAPQVGVLRRVILVVTDDGLLELINPELISAKGAQIGLEGCLSVPGVFGKVSRPFRVRVRYQDRDGKMCESDGEGIVARAFCHEINHLDGVLFTEFATEYVDTTRDDFTGDEEIFDDGKDFDDTRNPHHTDDGAYQ